MSESEPKEVTARFGVTRPNTQDYEELTKPRSYRNSPYGAFYDALMAAYNREAINSILTVEVPLEIRPQNFIRILENRGLDPGVDFVELKPKVEEKRNVKLRGFRLVRIQKVSHQTGRVIRQIATDAFMESRLSGPQFDEEDPTGQIAGLDVLEDGAARGPRLRPVVPIRPPEETLRKPSAAPEPAAIVIIKDDEDKGSGLSIGGKKK